MDRKNFASYSLETLLPNELLLDVLAFADYRTLVLASFAATPFLRVVAKYAGEVARRHSFHVDIYTTCVTHVDVTIGATSKSIRYESDDQSSLAAACRELNGEIGPHGVSVLKFYANTWNIHGVDAVFDAAPSLKYAEVVDLYSPAGATTLNDSEAFMRHFVGTKALRLWLTYEVFSRFSWTFLCQESARGLRRISVFVRLSANAEHKNRSVEDLVRYCAELSPLLGGEALELDFSDNDFSGAFGLRIIELLKNSRRDLIFRMRTKRYGGELVPHERDYTATVDGATKRYASKKSGIVVEVEGRSITIQSTAEVPRKKPKVS